MLSERYLVIGGSGYLGRQIVDCLPPLALITQTHFSKPSSAESIQFNFFEDNIADLMNLEQIDVIIFASAIEMNQPLELVSDRMGMLAEQCKSKRVVYLSSDGIFDGKTGFYTEEDAPSPITVYGQNLKCCEEIIAQVCSDNVIIRPSYIYGFSCGALDSRLANTKAKLEAGEQVEFFNDMYKSPLSVQQVAKAVISLAQSDYTGTIHVAGERLSVFEFQFRAMNSLNIDTENMKGVSMPKEKGFLKDTSLDASMWHKKFNVLPKSIEKSLA